MKGRLLNWQIFFLRTLFILHLLERDSELKELGQGPGEGGYLSPVDTTIATACEAGQP